MSESYVELVDENVDGCGTDVKVIFKVNVAYLTNANVERITNAIKAYKADNPNEWDSDGCFDAAAKQLEKDGYEVEYIIPSTTINF